MPQAAPRDPVNTRAHRDARRGGWQAKRVERLSRHPAHRSGRSASWRGGSVAQNGALHLEQRRQLPLSMRAARLEGGLASGSGVPGAGQLTRARHSQLSKPRLDPRTRRRSFSKGFRKQPVPHDVLCQSYSTVLEESSLVSSVPTVKSVAGLSRPIVPPIASCLSLACNCGKDHGDLCTSRRMHPLLKADGTTTTEAAPHTSGRRYARSAGKSSGHAG
mmetsp:Transcript_7697/g.20993  ORF Transcript_7697/g.20993 Transcript_7697/m.20993 type:complete len:218 (+) Transcript_7697:858-1511(+)